MPLRGDCGREALVSEIARDLQSDKVQGRYSEYLDERLADLARQDPNSFLSEAWADLQREIDKRRREGTWGMGAEDVALAASEMEREGGVEAEPIGGWLAFFAITSLLGLVVVIVWGLSSLKADPVLALFVLAGVPFFAYGLHLLAQRDPATPRYFQNLCWALALLHLASVVVLGPRALVRVIGCVIWAVYWRESDRVRRTFVHNSPSPGHHGEVI